MSKNKEIKKVGENYFVFVDSIPMLKLNEVGAFIYRLYLGSNTKEEIASALSTEYEVDYNEALEDVKDFLKSIPNDF